jgi:hypothetical protein
MKAYRLYLDRPYVFDCIDAEQKAIAESPGFRWENKLVPLWQCGKRKKL